MSVNEKMTAIADAIRGKTGKSESLTLDQMATEIAGIQGGGGAVERVELMTLVEELGIPAILAAANYKCKYRISAILVRSYGDIPPTIMEFTANDAMFFHSGASVSGGQNRFISAAVSPNTFVNDGLYGSNEQRKFTIASDGTISCPDSTVKPFGGAGTKVVLYEYPLQPENAALWGA